VKIAILHAADALEPPEDPVLGQIATALDASGHTSMRVCVPADPQPVIDALRDGQPDLIFNVAESFGGKSALESNVAALLNLLGCRYTGSSPTGLLLAGDKTLTKQILRFHGINTPEFATVYRGALDWAGALAFPVIVKPPQEDASLGITSASVVHDLEQLFAKMDEMQRAYQQPVLVEQYVEGREFYVGVLGNAQAVALPPIELDFSSFPADRPRIASWEAKWGDDGAGSGAEFAGTRSVLATDLDPDLLRRMQAAAVDAFHALRLRDYARVDLRVSADGVVHVLEVNPNCYLESHAEFAHAAAAAGMAYDALIARIVELALGRYAR
jgi:D-alanine-D-alanine ligase